MNDTTQFSVMYPRLVNELPRCPLPIIEDAIRETIREFCVQTQIWTLELDPLYVREEVTDYDIEKCGEPKYAVIDMPVKVVLDTRTLDPDKGEYYMGDRYTLVLGSEPSEDISQGLVVTVCLKPTQTATEIPNRLYEDYKEAFINGTLARLMMQPKKPWSNPALGSQKLFEYDRVEAAAKLHSWRKGTNKTLTVQPSREWVL